MPPLFSFGDFPKLITPCLSLSEYDVCQVEDVFAIRSDAVVQRYHSAPRTCREEIHDFILEQQQKYREQREISWASALHDSGRVVGSGQRLRLGSLLRPDSRRSLGDLELLLADDFREFGKSGRVWDKQSVIAMIAQESAAFEYTLEDFRVSLLAPTVALATYRILGATSGPGAEPAQALRSSVWVLRDSNWQLVFHQGTVSRGVASPVR